MCAPQERVLHVACVYLLLGRWKDPNMETVSEPPLTLGEDHKLILGKAGATLS